jgi:hypothetical protein
MAWQKGVKFTIDGEVNERILQTIMTQNPNNIKGDDSFTKDDLVDFIFYHTTPQPFSMTHRNVKYLMSYCYLSKKDVINGGSGYIHPDEVKKFVQRYFKVGKNNRGITFTSYGTMTDDKRYWEMLEACTQRKPDKSIMHDGFKPTQKCVDFCYDRITVPETIVILDNKVYAKSQREIKASKAKGMNYHECREFFKTH